MSIFRLHVAALALAVAVSGLLAGAGTAGARPVAAAATATSSSDALGAAGVRASAQPALTLRAPRRHLRVGELVRLDGTAPRSLSGKRVAIESPGTPWRRVATARVDQRGRFAVTVRVATSHYALRVRAPKGTVRGSTSSRHLRLAIHTPVSPRIRMQATSTPHPGDRVAIHLTAASRSAAFRLWHRTSPRAPWRLVEKPQRYGHNFAVELPRGYSAYRVEAVARQMSSLRLGWSNAITHDLSYPDGREPAGDVTRHTLPANAEAASLGRRHTADLRYTVLSRRVAASGDRPQNELYLHDRTTGTERLITADAAGRPAEGSFTLQDVSADGRFVAYTARSTTIVDAPTQIDPDLPAHLSEAGGYVWDALTGENKRIVGADRLQKAGFASPSQMSISDDGSRVAYRVNLVDPTVSVGGIVGTAVLVWDRATADSTLVTSARPRLTHRASPAVQITPDGRYVAFLALPDDADASEAGVPLAYRFDTSTGDVVQASPQLALHVSIADDGSRVAFMNGRQVGIWDASTEGATFVPLEATTTVWHGATLSGNGQHVVFTAQDVRLPTQPSHRRVLANGIFAYTLATGRFQRIDLRADGDQRPLGDRVIDVDADAARIVFAVDGLLREPFVWTRRR